MSQEFGAGQTLAQMTADNGGLFLDIALDIVYQVGEFLEALHSQRRVHGAISPASIFLGQDGKVQVLDSERAALEEEIAHHYQAPEVRAGEPVKPCADFYALGVTLYKALTGEVPTDPQAPWPGDKCPGLPPELDELVAKCLNTDPSRRVQSAYEFLDGVEDVRNSLAQEAGDTIIGMEDLLVGQTLGSYRLVERLGQGGMATVYKAYEPALSRYVAIKVLPQFFAHDPNFMRRFQREAKASARLSHPNIVSIHSFDEQDGITYIAMQFVDGGTLKQSRGLVYESKEAIRLALPILRALAYAHEQGIVHRDIKPSNVLMANGDWPVLADFGLAQMAEVSMRLTGTGVGVGTPAYMSPEQGQGVNVDHRTDIYSMGIMLYEMLTGDVPFRTDTPMAIVIKHITAPIPPPRTINPRIPEALELIVLKATAKAPDDRYQSADEMATALEEVLTQISGLASEGSGAAPKIADQFESRSQPDLTAIPSATPMRRNWRKLALVLVPVIALVFIGGLLLLRQLFSNGQALPGLGSRVTETSVAEAVVAVPSTEEPAHTPTDTPSPTFTIVPTLVPEPTQTSAPAVAYLGGGTGQVAFVSDREGDMQIYLVSIDSGENPQLLAEIPGGACQPAWSPDGSQLVFVSPCESQEETYPNSSLYLIDANSNNMTMLPLGATGNYDPAWSLDGNRIAFTSLRDGRAQVYIYTLADQSVELISDKFSHNFQPIWAPDGERIAFVSSRFGNSLIFIMSVEGREVSQFSRTSAAIYTHPRWSPDGSAILYMKVNEDGITNLKVSLIEEQGFSEKIVIPKFVEPMRDPAYSPDGLWVAFSSNRDGTNHNIWLVSANGIELWELTTDPAHDFDPAWRP